MNRDTVSSPPPEELAATAEIATEDPGITLGDGKTRALRARRTGERHHFAERLAALASAPGVYLMKDAEGVVIYVGKAQSLRDRVRSYFGSPRSMTGKTRELV